MIRDLSLSLRAMLTDHDLAAGFPELAGAVVAFDRPTEGWNPAQTAINLFLYDIHEDVALRSNEPVVERKDGTVTVRRPATRIDCTYLLTAWPVGVPEPPLFEHLLLGEALQVLAARSTIPSKYLQGKLKDQEIPPPLVTAQGAETSRSLSEFWAAVGNKIRPSLTVSATIALDPFAPFQDGPEVITSSVVVGESADPARVPGAPRFAIGGRVFAADGSALPGLPVRVPGLGLVSVTDGEGRYAFPDLPGGSHGVTVERGSTLQPFTIQVPAPAGVRYDLKF